MSAADHILWPEFVRMLNDYQYAAQLLDEAKKAGVAVDVALHDFEEAEEAHFKVADAIDAD